MGIQVLSLSVVIIVGCRWILIIGNSSVSRLLTQPNIDILILNIVIFNGSSNN
jgi:hypothetical protein